MLKGIQMRSKGPLYLNPLLGMAKRPCTSRRAASGCRKQASSLDMHSPVTLQK